MDPKDIDFDFFTIGGFCACCSELRTLGRLFDNRNRTQKIKELWESVPKTPRARVYTDNTNFTSHPIPSEDLRIIGVELHPR